MPDKTIVMVEKREGCQVPLMCKSIVEERKRQWQEKRKKRKKVIS